MLREEFENVVADEILAAFVGDAEDVDDAEGIVLDGEFVVFDYQVLGGISAAKGDLLLIF